uniref:SFRICE_026837 n=1 Tax=Spodoptera frugiperda TaxID=7108 RepID=A0A2H1WKY0_SPOFR
MPAVPGEHKIYFDNFFSSCDLFIQLATGTIRDNRTKKCPLTSVKDMKKSERVQFDYRFDTMNQVLLVRWKDNSVCTIGTNFDTVIESIRAQCFYPSRRRRKCFQY